MSTTTAGVRLLRARALRYFLTLCIHDLRIGTVGELAAQLAAEGFAVAGRPSKVISDALRWEIARGRVVRLGRGRYGPGRLPRSTAYRIRNRVDDLRGPGHVL